MDSFYLTILSIATIVLILALTYVGILLYSTKSVQTFPPIKNACPDYWELDSSGKCIFPETIASKNRGNITTDNSQKWKVTETTFTRLTGDNAIISYGPPPSGSPSTPTSPTYFDMNSSGWNNIYGKKNALCNQKYWANSNGISWDGVSNTNEC